MKGYSKPLLVIFLVLLVDQTLKFWVKLNMTLGQEYHILGDRFLIHFTENNGMAFGLELGGDAGKLLLTLFRILAVSGIAYGIVYLIKKKYHRGLIFNISLILAGAIGNIIDSTFYGVLFTESTYYEPAKLLSKTGGYAGFFHGKVVDMLYFPLIEGVIPKWMPIGGGESFIFFNPVFNVADASISIGVILILVFQKRYFKEEKKEESQPHSEIVEE